MRGDQALAATLTPHPLLAHLDVLRELHHPFFAISYFNLLPPLNANPYLYFAPINIISWNTRGVGSSNFRKAFREMSSSYNPDIIILTKTHLSGDRETSIVSSLGF